MQETSKTTAPPSPLVATLHLRFAHDIDLMGGSSNELHDLTSRLVARASAYGMEVSTEKSKVMVNGTNEISVNITMNGKPLEEVTSFKYLGTGIAQWLERRTRD